MIVTLAFRNLVRRPVRTGLSLIGLAVSVACLATLLAFSDAYRASLKSELDRSGVQMMLVPIGCPYDAAAQVLKGRALATTLPDSALSAARSLPEINVASPVFAAAIPRPDAGRTDLWVGVDDTARLLRPWWKLSSGAWPTKPDHVLLGAEAAETELRKAGDTLHSPETGRTFRVCGILARSGTSDDSQFFLPLATAQNLFRQPGRLTGIGIKLHDPSKAGAVRKALQDVPGAQVVTLTEMVGAFLNLLGAGRALLTAVTITALAISSLSVFNTMLAASLERTREIGILRAVGVGRGVVFALFSIESVALSLTGCLLGFGLGRLIGPVLETLVRPFLPLAPTAALPTLNLVAVLTCCSLLTFVGLIAGAFPAWRASRIPPAAALSDGGFA